MRAHITGFRPDPAEPGAWIAELSCGHTQHVRHQPPFQERSWVLTPEGRVRFIGTEVDCPHCDEEPSGGKRSHELSSPWID